MNFLDSKSDYYDVSFSKVDFSGSTLEDTTFEDCEFNHCNFSSAKISRCKFNHCAFNNCNLSVIEIPDTRFYEIYFNECKLSGIDWTNANWPTFNLDFELNFTKCILTNSSFLGLKLHNLKMEECRLVDVDFRECDLSNSVLTGCDFLGSLFNLTILRSVNFTDSWDYSIDVLNNTVTKAKFSKLEALSLLENLGIELVD
ncbi:pentapeptide repeat-containing protein [Xenorhabdus nematophila]|uniref:pentapeptide repeat-containing protein n=1 Tax=Xenorhabdus nematophila TaxID=628 RepID=UPI000542C9ED|nr:pentapeptide repeat-containing protein [Xenorhabdus nematophila]CEF32120.1 McbG-like protein [Xenorhabdus nematophila str. Websteri]AYA41995.1 pentapeptide repeat-containing protein [Xenorhabdus nematophila]KHD28329.1 pentapeptide repeat protein McbG [Xenorhabdus nematophila]MBA0020715.1 pentapeptide repeat-containing protein [Xenorhabdus nematophila]MCB4425448.1 pentapeptide repeat-containing protein [Xenorhabdus nematophila]